jgi:hypothetical protein
MQKKTIIKTIKNYISISQVKEPECKKKFWDQNEKTPILVPEESVKPLIGWVEIEAYWANSINIMATLNSTTSNYRVREINSELTLTTYNMRWVATMRKETRYNGKTLAADVRVTALLRLRAGEWKFFHLMEGPIDLMTMTRQYYSLNIGKNEPSPIVGFS